MYITDEVREVLSPFSIYFNGIDLSERLFPKEDKGRGLPAREVLLIKVPGKAGGLLSHSYTPERHISQEVLIACESAEELRKELEYLSKILHTDEPAPLVFEDEADRTYYAIYAGADEGYEIGGFYTATIRFICPDPYKYAPLNSTAFTAGQTMIQNKGTIPVFPIVKATVLSDITHLQVFDGERFFQIGEAVGVESTIKKREELLLNDAMPSLVGWSSSGLTVDGGIVAGAMESNGFSFGASSYGASTEKVWRGPGVKKSVPQAPLVDFKIRMKFILKNPSAAARGRIECYLLDEQSVDFGKFAMKRTGAGGYGNAVEARAGGGSDYKYFASYAGARGIEWRDFDGLMELTRINNVWTVYTALVDPVTKKHHTRATFTHNDIQQKFVRNLAQIQLHIAAHGTTEPTIMRIGSLEVFRINQITKEETNVMAVAEDEIELNFKTKKIYLNGELRPDLKVFGAKFFALPPGSNTLLLEPAVAVNAGIEWEEGYL